VVLRAARLRCCSAGERRGTADPHAWQVQICQIRLDQKSIEGSLGAGLCASSTKPVSSQIRLNQCSNGRQTSPPRSKRTRKGRIQKLQHGLHYLMNLIQGWRPFLPKLKLKPVMSYSDLPVLPVWVGKWRGGWCSDLQQPGLRATPLSHHVRHKSQPRSRREAPKAPSSPGTSTGGSRKGPRKVLRQVWCRSQGCS